MRKPFGSRRIMVAFLIVLGLAAVLRVALLTHQSLWFDEGYSLSFSDHGLRGAWASLTDKTSSERVQPMYMFALAAWRGAFGSSEEALRLLSVACGILAVVLLFAAARRWFGDRQALVTMLLAATSALAVYYSQEVRAYALVLLLASLVMFAACGRARWALAVAAGVGFLGTYLVGFFVVALAVAELLVYRRPRAWLRRWYPAVLAMLPALGLYLLASQVRDPAGALQVAQRTDSLIRNAVFVPYGLLVGTTYGPPVEALHYGGAMALMKTHALGLGGLAVVALILAWGVTAALRRSVLGDRERERGLILVLTFLFTLLGSLAVAAVTGVNWLPRHSICALVPMYLLLPLTARSLCHPAVGAQRRRSLVAIASAVCLVALIAMNSLALMRYYADDAYARSDYRAVADYLKRRPAADPVVLLFAQADLLRYYGLKGAVDGQTFTREHLGRDLAAHGFSRQTLYLVVDMEYYYWGASGTRPGVDRMATLLGPGYHVVERLSWGSFSVYRVEPAIGGVP